APSSVLGHYATLAQWYSNLVQDLTHLRSQRFEPASLVPAFRAVQIDDGILLVGGQQTFPASRRAEGRDGIRTGSCAAALGDQLGFGQLSRPARDSPDFGADDGRNSPGVDVLGKQTARNERQLCPSSSELGRRSGAGALVAQDNGVGGAVAQQITSRQCTDDVSIRILNTEMAVGDPGQAAGGTINE